MCRGEKLEPSEEAGRVIQKRRNLEKEGDDHPVFPTDSSTVCSAVCMLSRADRHSPREVWEVIHPEIQSQLREEGVFLFCFEADRHAVFFLPVFKGLQRRKDKAEGGDSRRGVQGSFTYQLRVFFAPPFPVFHLPYPTNRNLGNSSGSWAYTSAHS